MHYHIKQSTGAVVTSAAKDVSYSLGLQVLDTFNSAFAFTLGLLTHELVKEWSEQQWSNQKFFSWLIFMFIAFLTPKLREWYIHGLPCVPSEKAERVTPAVNASGYGSSHGGYYVT